MEFLFGKKLKNVSQAYNALRKLLREIELTTSCPKTKKVIEEYFKPNSMRKYDNE
jgi:hypothetical protein